MLYSLLSFVMVIILLTFKNTEMKDVHFELIKALQDNNLPSWDAIHISDLLGKLHGDISQEYTYTDYLTIIKKAIQQTLINCKGS